MAWVEMFESHTPYEWRMQQARAIVDPWGEDRADVRSQINTSQLIAASQPENTELRDATAKAVAAYYETEQDDPNELPLNPDAIKALPKAAKR